MMYVTSTAGDTYAPPTGTAFFVMLFISICFCTIQFWTGSAAHMRCRNICYQGHQLPHPLLPEELPLPDPPDEPSLYEGTPLTLGQLWLDT